MYFMALFQNFFLRISFKKEITSTGESIVMRRDFIIKINYSMSTEWCRMGHAVAENKLNIFFHFVMSTDISVAVG